MYGQRKLYLNTINDQKIQTMKKILVLAVAAFLVSGVSFAHEGNGKKCGKGTKESCSKDCKDGKKKSAAKKA